MTQRRTEKTGRKTFANDKPERKLPPGVFAIHSISALKDFLKFRPTALKSVACRPQVLAKVRAMLDERGVSAKLIQPMSEEVETGRDQQGLEALVSLQSIDEEKFFKKIANRERDTVVILDHITDPRNLGAIIRSAAFFGIRDVIIAQDRQVPMTQAAVATSQGGFSFTDLTMVVNLGRVIDQLKEKGYWVLGADMDGEQVQKLTGIYEKVVLVMGAEDKGMASSIRKRCDRFVKIDGFSGFDSLNVSVACGICLHELTKGSSVPD